MFYKLIVRAVNDFILSRCNSCAILVELIYIVCSVVIAKEVFTIRLNLNV